MTHDELVRFAAEKVGESIIIRSVCTQTIGDEDIFESRWFYQEPDGFCDEPFDLTSPDLFFKGLAVCPYEVDLFKGRNECTLPDSMEIWNAKHDVQAIRILYSMSEIPQKFWECWAEVEGKGDLTKEG